MPDHRDRDFDFDDLLDASGSVSIAGLDFAPSDILFQMDPDAYSLARAAYRTERIEDLTATVEKNFPQPIAHSFLKFLRGSENNIVRLHHLRDVWERLILLLHALVISECLRKLHRFSDVGISKSKILSDKLGDKLENLEGALSSHSSGIIQLDFVALFDQPVLDELRALNRSRNEFSHGAALTEEQAGTQILSLEPRVLALLELLEPLSQIKILRYHGTEGDIHRIRFHEYNGSNLSDTFETLELSTQELSAAQPCLRANRISAHYNNRLYNLGPFLHFARDIEGHIEKICIMKRKGRAATSGKIEYNVIAGEQIHLEEVTLFSHEMGAIDALQQ